MKIPAFFLGEHRKVKLKCHKIAKQVMQGETFHETVSELMLDTSETSGLIVLERCDSSLGKHFYAYLLLDEIRELSFSSDLESRQKVYDRCFQESLQSAWGTLGLVALGNQCWVHAPQILHVSKNGERFVEKDPSQWDGWINQRCKPLLNACLEHWDTFCEVGERYFSNLPCPRNLWNLNNTLYKTLFQLGVPPEAFTYPQAEQSFPHKVYRPLTAEKLCEIIAFAKQDQLI